MAKYTDNYNLILPEQNENYDVDVANTNNREIDFQLGNKVNKIPGKALSTNDFTNEYKSKIDNLQKIYKFKGNVDTYSDLNNISANNGDIYNVLDEAKNYAWNGTEWVPLGFVIDMSEFAYREEIPTKNSELDNDSNFVDEETLNQTKNDMEALSVPTGGTKGQILEKKSNEDNDVGWVDNTGGVTGDTLPIGTVVDFDGETVPENWEEVEDEKVLWEGNDDPNGKTYALLHNIYNYRFAIVVGQWGVKFLIPIIKDNTYLNGGTNYPLGNGTAMATVGLTASIIDGGMGISVTYFRSINHTQSDSHGSFENLNLLKIIGIE